jgi:BNR repeat protein
LNVSPIRADASRATNASASTLRLCLIAVCAAILAPTAAAAPPQGFQSDASFAASYSAQSVAGVAATTQRVSCYTPQVFYAGALSPSQGYPDGGATPCAGSATTGEVIGPFATQDVSNPPLRAKDFSESDLHVDPTNPRHVIGISKWFVNAEGYNHLTGFYESYDGGATWPQQGHIPGYEGWTDNSDPVGAFDPWGNFYAVVLPYMFGYLSTGQHFFLSPDVNPALPRSGMAVAVRPHGASTPASWLVTHNGAPDLIRRTPFNGAVTFDKQWIAIDTSRRSRHFGRVYVSWAIGTDEGGLRIYLSYADARRNGTHTNWSVPRRMLQQRRGISDNGSLPRVTPDGRLWLATSSAITFGAPYTMSFTSSSNGGRTWARRRVIVRHNVNGYKNTTFRPAFGEAFEVGKRKVGRFYPLYAVYENAVGNGPTQLFVRGSFDGGRHWRAALQVNDDQNDGEALQPNIAVAPNGRVAVAFYDRRLPCAARDTAEATLAGLLFDPRAPFGRTNYCVNTAIQFYTATLKPLGHNIRLSPHTWDPQLSSPHTDCICSNGTFIGDYFGVDSRGGFTYTTSVETYNASGENPGFHQQQLVSKLRTP